MEKVTLIGGENYSLSLAVFEAKNAKAVIQIVHGMEEHKERYYPFAEFLNKNGISVVVSDLRGHGEDAPLLSHIADKKGEVLLLDDQRQITKYIKERFAGLPLYLMGHSMGSIIVRDLIQLDSKEYQKVLLSGYVNPNGASGIAVFLGNLVKLFKGAKGHSKLLTTLAVGQFAKSIKDKRTELDWLSYNEENVDKYIADPLSGVEFTVGSYSALFHLLNWMGKANRYKEVNKEVPILLAGGVDDPCTGFEKGKAASKKVLEKAGFTNISVITYDKMRHEILNETNKETVYQDFLEFFKK